jgi:hypothetical protein
MWVVFGTVRVDVSMPMARSTREVGDQTVEMALVYASALVRCHSQSFLWSPLFGGSRFASKLVYSGKWVADLPNGKGTCEYPTGHMYDGMWRNGLRHGEVRALLRYRFAVRLQGLLQSGLCNDTIRVVTSRQRALCLMVCGETTFDTVQAVKLIQMAPLSTPQ